MTLEFTEPLAYFDGQRLTAADMTAAQSFQRGLRWLHNRALHPAGIVEGLVVEGARDDIAVRVAPGFALDGLGRELLLLAPATVAVPPITGGAPGQPARVLLTLRYDDEPAESRTGVCGTAGVVRRDERPLLRFREAADPELDVVLAGVQVAGCRLASAPSAAERRVVAPSPRVAAGRTPAGSTPWQHFASGAGVETTVDTTAAAFSGTPLYQARVAGERVWGSSVVDGPLVIADPSATSFVARVLLPGPLVADRLLINPDGVRLPGFLPSLTAQGGGALGWHVVWMGVEA